MEQFQNHNLKYVFENYYESMTSPILVTTTFQPRGSTSLDDGSMDSNFEADFKLEIIADIILTTEFYHFWSWSRYNEEFVGLCISFEGGCSEDIATTKELAFSLAGRKVSLMLKRVELRGVKGEDIVSRYVEDGSVLTFKDLMKNEQCKKYASFKRFKVHSCVEALSFILCSIFLGYSRGFPNSL